MKLFVCKKNSGIFHGKPCKCTDEEAEVDRILFFMTDYKDLKNK